MPTILTFARVVELQPGDRIRFTELREVWWSRALRWLGVPLLHPVRRERWVRARVVSTEGETITITDRS